MPAVQVVRLSCGSPKTVNVSFYEIITIFLKEDSFVLSESLKGSDPSSDNK